MASVPESPIQTEAWKRGSGTEAVNYFRKKAPS